MVYTYSREVPSIELFKPSGVVILDDFTSDEAWPASWCGKLEPKRNLTFDIWHFTATEICWRPDSTILLIRDQAAS
jgi:hypothetical protein